METLKGRMEVAYNAKEQQAFTFNLNGRIFLMSIFERLIQVEAELGTMREQLSSELRRAVGGSEKGDARPLLTDSEMGSMRN